MRVGDVECLQIGGGTRQPRRVRVAGKAGGLPAARGQRQVEPLPAAAGDAAGVAGSGLWRRYSAGGAAA